MGFTAGLRALGLAAVAAASVATLAAPTAAASTSAVSASSAASRVVRIAEAQRGKRYVFGAEGPSAFDCSGLVVYAYRAAGVANHLGGGHSGYGMAAWARAHRALSSTSPQVGDVVVYGGGAHVGIYIGSGDVISALNPSQGIRITAVRALHLPVTGYIHTHLTGGAVAAHATRVVPYAARPLVLTRVYARLRAGASTSSRTIVVMPPGARLRLIGSVVVSGKRWDHVVYGRRIGWIRSDLVRAG